MEIAKEIYGIEVKRSMAPNVSMVLNQIIGDLQPPKLFIIYPGNKRYRLTDGVEVIGVMDILVEIK